MSGLVQRLLERGLIEMQRSTVDRRRQVWRTTTSGRGLLAQLRPLLGSLVQQLDQQVAPSEQLAAQGLCERLSAAAAELASVIPLAPIVPLPAKQGAAA
jgi:DNA-binding MarR family transcriptional regulator